MVAVQITVKMVAIPLVVRDVIPRVRVDVILIAIVTVKAAVAVDVTHLVAVFAHQPDIKAVINNEYQEKRINYRSRYK